MIPVKSADGVTGHLLWMFNGEYCFRVYNEDQTFIDYDLKHVDLIVTIKDADAFFYKDGKSDVLDHAPATLGLENDNAPTPPGTEP